MTNNERVNRWRAANRERVRQQSADRWANDPKYREAAQRRRATPGYRAKEHAYQAALRRDATTWPKQVIRDIRRRCKAKGIPFNIDASDIPVPDVCPILGKPFVFGQRAHAMAPSVDRHVPALGYVKGNVAVISYRANTMKSDCTDPSVLRRLADWMERDRG